MVNILKFIVKVQLQFSLQSVKLSYEKESAGINGNIRDRSSSKFSESNSQFSSYLTYIIRSWISLRNVHLLKKPIHSFCRGPKSRESSQSLDVIVDMSTGQLQEESDTPRNAAVLNHPVVLVSVLVLLALVFLVLLVVVLSCAFNRNCYAKRSRDRRRPKEIVSINPDQERYLLPPAYHDPAQQLAVHCISSPLSRSIISHNQVSSRF